MQKMYIIRLTNYFLKPKKEVSLYKLTSDFCSWWIASCNSVLLERYCFNLWIKTASTMNETVRTLPFFGFIDLLWALKPCFRFFFASENYLGSAELVRILWTEVLAPARKQYDQIFRKCTFFGGFTFWNNVVYYRKLFCVREKCTRRNFFCESDHTLEVVFIRNIPGNVITEHSLHECDRFDLLKIRVSVVVENVEVFFVRSANTGAICCELPCIAIFEAWCGRIAGLDRGKGNWFDIPEFFVSGGYANDIVSEAGERIVSWRDMYLFLYVFVILISLYYIYIIPYFWWTNLWYFMNFL